ncbi:MAG: BlaI/MecI/CopY family transcriptional regulator [Gammaproteobacteria bacterium]|jgi:predicted transcriptional regulator|nr:BlaI/MecI/CopY family transcriptional regulator [Gammaproteobacteria bacterium]MBT3859813.1 BlaI/MecI/CopY family transcriptional regulator [Gammaproteobacteria bacterium]MBT3988857.1 BlaI/MecI/CopY family transcriptional regulator [Gammaproteobacteria bacterium]MBT4254922.1 BlaI/MecI/CopY family transcriptional regulator [Gammaproteobacteria bacterium]MBT4580891.1 BlaI/MecI/CopY family transcriptional regulator [Gammaproteobacteria bacterium]
MNVIWDLQNASVKNVVEVLQKDSPVAYNTVQTMMRILEDKDYVRHTKSGRSFVYIPLVDRKKARSEALKHLISSFFGGTPQSLVVDLLEDEEMDALEIQKLKDLINNSD